LPTCNKQELQATVKQTTGFALVASAFTLHSDNFLAGTAHGIYVGLVVSGIMTLVLVWEALPEILERVCRTIDASADSLAEAVEKVFRGLCQPSGACVTLSAAGSQVQMQLSALVQPDFAVLSIYLNEFTEGCRRLLPKLKPAALERLGRRFSPEAPCICIRKISPRQMSFCLLPECPSTGSARFTRFRRRCSQPASPPFARDTVFTQLRLWLKQKQSLLCGGRSRLLSTWRRSRTGTELQAVGLDTMHCSTLSRIC
jgi:hypothetical protein